VNPHNSKSTKAASITGLLMDSVYAGTGMLIIQGVACLPVCVHAGVVVLSVYGFLYLYRYVFIWKIGASAEPVLQQIGIKPPKIITYLFHGIFALTMPVFPLLLILVSMVLVLGLSEQTTSQLLWFLPYVIILPLTFFNILIYIDQWQGNIPLNLKYFPQPAVAMKKNLTTWIIPCLAILAGYSLSTVSHSIARLSNDPVSPFYQWDWYARMFLSLTVFVPFRYLVMRTAGATPVSFISFAVSVAIIAIF